MAVSYKKIGCAAIVVVVLILFAVLLIPFTMGLSIGAESAHIENEIKDNCKCNYVEYIKYKANNQNAIDDLLSGKLTKTFTYQLKNCNYKSLDSLKNDISKVLLEKEFCQDKTIIFKLSSFEGEAKNFKIGDCNIVEDKL